MLHPRLAALVDGDGRARRKTQLRAMGHSTKNVSHVPVGRLRRARHRFATLHVLGIGLAAAIDVRAEGGTADGADGFEYEARNRMTLCRCGGSKNKPFCDGTHLSIKFSSER